nr:CoA transferase [uncultured Brevundimonas sp.]
MASGPNGPVADVRILDFGRVLSAPWATQLLGDMGADVIKVERPDGGDDARYYGPATIRDREGKATNNAAIFISANRNKRSITLDLATSEGRETALQLVRSCDVLVENFIPGAMARLGLGYDTVRQLRPDIIYCSVSGYGQDGPMASLPGYDAVFQAESGMMAITGKPDGVPGGGPMKTGPSLVDVTSGLYAASAILAALYHRARTGEGQHLDVSLFETALAMQSGHPHNYLLSGEQPARLGNEGNGGHPARTFDCRDGVIYISAGSTRHFHRLCDVVGAGDIRDHPDYQTPLGRHAARGAINTVLEPIIAGYATQALEDALRQAGVPCAVVRGYRDTFAHPQIVARGVRFDLPHPTADTGTVPMIGAPVRFSRTPLTYRRAPPELGQHTDEVKAEAAAARKGEAV